MQPPRQPPPPRMMNLCSASQAAFLSTNPMLQGALLMQQMQGNLRGFAVNGQQYQQFQQFFPAGAGPSLLGPVPMGVSMKTPRMGFPSHHYHPHNRNFSKDFARAHDRKREMDLRIQARASDARQEGGAEGEQSERAANTDERPADPESQAEPSTEHQEEPAFKKQRLESSEEQMGEQCVSDEQQAQNAEEKTSREEGERDSGVAAERILTEDGVIAAGSEAMEFAEVLSAGGSLKVTIQQSSESRAISTSAPESAVRNSDTDAEAASKYYCYICNITCYNQQNFQSHMNGLAHQQRMMEIQHMSNACLVTLLPKVKASLQGQSQSKTDGENRHALQRWCTTCQVYFTGDLIEHRRTKEHKLSKHSSRPFCTVCKCHFRTPRKFVEHMKSPEHKHKVEELRSEAREHGGPENPEELITVDAIGCFEGEEDYEEDPSEEEEEEEESSMETLRANSRQREVMLEELTEDEQYDSETQYGSSFVVPVAGFLCRLCHKFYHFESTARLSHCKSLMHFQNLQKYRAFRSLEAAEAQESGTIVEEHPDDTLQVAGQELGAETGVNLMEMGPADFSGTNREQGYGTTNSDSMPSDRTGSESPNPVKIVFDSPDPVKSGTDSTDTVKTISKRPSPGTVSLYGLSQTKNSLLLDDLEEDAALREQALDLSSSSNDCISKEVLEEQMDRNPEQRKGIPQTEGPVQEQDEDNVEGEQDRPQAEVEEEGETEEPGNMRSKGSSAEKEGEVEGSERPAGWQPCGAGANVGKRRSTRTRRSR